MDINQLSYAVIGAIIEVHRQLGPGLPEGLYQEALELELAARAIPFESNKKVLAHYKGTALKNFFRLDLLIDGRLIVELKAVETIHPIHEAQLLTYMRLTRSRIGLLVNFNVEKATDGIHRRILDV